MKHPPLSNPSDASNDGPTPEDARRLVAKIDAMLPGVIASEERDARQERIFRARREGRSFGPHQSLFDLEEILQQIVSCVRNIRDKQGHLDSDSQGVIYVHRATLLALRDYARPHMLRGQGLWDTVSLIHETAHDALAEHGRMTATLETVYRLARAALNGDYATNS